MAHSVLLVQCSSETRGFSINTLPPLGVLSIASFLEHRGIPTDVVDLSVDPRALQPGDYDIIGFSINISNAQNSFRTIECVRASYPKKTIVVGGPLCMSNPELFTQTGHADAVFVCEGEEALFEYLTSDTKEKVKGIYLKDGGEYLFTGARGWIGDLDSLPFAALHKVDVRRYDCFPKRKRPISSMMTSRGCPYSCIFCSHAMGRKWRPRSPENVVEEIQRQVADFGVREICIYDDNFSLDKRRAETICDLLVDEKVPVALQFSNGLRVDSLDSELLAKLKAAGTWLIGLAPETGNPEIMRKIRKGFDHSQVVKTRRECRKLGIKTFGFYMIGFPFEGKREIEETIRFAKQLDCEIVEFNKVIPYPGTELYDLIVEGGYLLADQPSAAQSYHVGPLTTHRVGDLSPVEVKDIIRRAYRQYYLRPKKMLDLLRTFSVGDLWGLTTYAFRTGNI